MNTTIIKIKSFALTFFIAGSLFAQNKLTKVSQSIKVNKDVTIDLNTSYTNIIFDTWNKGTVEIEAYIEGDDLSKDELEKALKSWTVNIDASTDKVSISTKSNAPHVWAYNYSHNYGDSDAVKAVLKELKFELADLPDMDFDFNFEMPELPEMPEFPEMPELPELPEGVNNINFDYKAYKKDGDKYLEEYTKKFESTFGKDYADKMEAWGEKFGKEWGEKYGKDMEEWAKKFEGKFNNEEYTKKMEIWGERFAERMEQQAERIEEQVERTKEQKERIEKQHEERAKMHEKLAGQREQHAQEREKLAKERKVLIERMVDKSPNSKVKKTIKIKMPKGAKLKVNVRHGELEFASNIDNLKADLSYTKFTANSVNGGSTSINASYSPIHVTYWNLGELNLNYVKEANLNNVKSMILTSNSSNVNIDNFTGNAIIDGNIGNLKISKIDDTFTNLNLLIQNCDAVIVLPKTDYNLQYKGTRSRFSHPEKTIKEHTSSFTSNNSNTSKTIVVNAKYSNVVMK
tara:strand:- start:3744 stop:5291 length:1548 start_codon:yes stop_codon:yes gene_type:complete